MARPITPLSDSKCEAAKPREKAYKLADGQGLYLFVRPNGSKVWRMKYTRPNGSENTLTFGEYGRQGISLAKAREKRRKARDLLAQGIDPAEQAKREEAQAKNATTFEAVTREWHAAQVKRGKWSAGHAERILREMEGDLFPALGKRPVEQLKTRDLLAPLLEVEARDALDMAARLRQRLCAVMRYATQTGIIDYNPAQDLSGAISTRKTVHRPALPLERLGELLERIDGYSGRTLTKYALQLTLQASLQARIEQAATRSQGIEEEIAKAKSAAESAEQAAGQALAQAEDAKAEKAARTQLEKAVELALATEATVRVKRRTIETMEAEVANMKQQAADSRQREQVAKAALSEALWSKYAEEWNAAAKTLAGIGARLVAADRVNGGWGAHLTKLHIPLFGTQDRETLTRTEVVDASDEIALDVLVGTSA